MGEGGYIFILSNAREHKKLENLLGDKREDSLTSLEEYDEKKLLLITKLSSLWCPKLFLSYIILPLEKNFPDLNVVCRLPLTNWPSVFCTSLRVNFC